MKLPIDKAVASRLIFIGGSEEAIRRRALREIRSKLITDGDDFDSETIVAESGNFMSWIGAAATAPFLSEFRTIVVRNALRDDEPDKPEKIRNLEQLPPYARLILVADEDYADEQKQERVSKAWQKAVQKAGGVLVLAEVDAKSAAEEVRAEAERQGKRLSPTAANTLLEMVGGSYSAASEEVAKLVLYCQDSPEILERDVQAVVTASREWNVFKLGDAFTAGQPAAAIRQLRILLSGSTKPEEAAFRNILPNLTRQFRFLWQARTVIELGASASEQWPSNPNLGKQADWLQNKIRQSASKLKLDQIESCLHELADCDARLKGQLEGMGAVDALETLINKTAAILR